MWPFRKSIDELQHAAWDALELGRNERAIKLGQRLIRHRHTSGFEISALAALGLKQPHRAIELLRDGVSVAPTVFRLWTLLGSTLSELGRYDEALSAYENSLICEHCNRGVVAHNRAVILSRQKRLDEALHALDAYGDIQDAELGISLVSLRMSLLNELGRHSDVLDYIPLLENPPELSEHSSGRPERTFILSRGVARFETPSVAISKAWLHVLEAQKALGAGRDELLEMHGLPFASTTTMRTHSTGFARCEILEVRMQRCIVC